MKITATTLSLSLALVLTGAALTACGDNPVEPEAVVAPPPPQKIIKTPKALILRKITVKAFASKKANGKNWDLISKKADIYVALQPDYAGSFPVINSKTVKDASHDKSYTFKHTYEIKYKDIYKIHLVDDDFGGNETMANATVNLSRLYKKDNADGLSVTIRGNKHSQDPKRKFKVQIVGDWVY